MHGACAAPAHAPHACANEITWTQSLAVLEADVARTEGRHELGKRVELAAAAAGLVARAAAAATEGADINVQVLPRA
jgi:hypothetical protein